MQELKDISKVVGVLDYGPFEWHKRKVLIITLVILTIVMLFAIAFLVTMLSIEHIASQDPNAPFIISMIFLGMVFLVPSTIFLVFLIRNEKLRGKIQLYMEDAIVVKAKTKKIDSRYSFPFFIESSKIQVDFTIDGKHYQRLSRNALSKSSDKGGYYPIWSKYVDREITIAYSPKYDEVMILNDKKIKQV